jgi:4-amino-4-deoxy-L-arabinose transferase-like glycosyltransferase
MQHWQHRRVGGRITRRVDSAQPDKRAERALLRAWLPASEHWVLLGILAVACGVRVRYLSAGVPYAVGIDEPAVVNRALRILQTCSWNPGGFDYPSLVIYLQACVAAVRFVIGALQGQWTSLDRLDINAVYEAGRFVAAIIGTATVWLTYRLGKDVDSRALGLVAAAEIAVFPMHVRESHFILTDVPATALVTLTLLLALRAWRVRSVSAYGWAGCAAGLSAAAKYNGIFAAAAVAIALLVAESTWRDRGRDALAALLAASLAFLIAVPYSILDLPGFLNGLGGQLARFAQPSSPGDAPWRSYLVHLSLAWSYWLPTAALGAAIVVGRRRSLRRWAVPTGFIALYYYVLASHSVVFGRYALPLIPGICLLAAVPVVEVARAAERRFRRGAVAPLLLSAGALAVSANFARESISWLAEFRRPDTRSVAARWMSATLEPGTRVVAENSGPTNLDHAGFVVVDRPNHVSEPLLDSYLRQRVAYVLIAPWSPADRAGYGALLDAGSTVFQIEPSGNERWGPYVRVVRLPAR